MTLVVAILNSQTAFMLSDILLTSKPSFPGEQDQPHPTQSKINVSRARVVSELCQKVVELKPGLFLGWSGDHSVARKLIEFLRDIARSGNKVFEEVKLAQTQFFALHQDDVADLSTIIMSINSDGVGLILYSGALHKRNIKASIDGLGEVLAIGTGASAFLSTVSKTNLQYLQDESHEMPLVLRQTSFVLEYVLRTLSDQHLTGIGLNEGWGGAFELILSRGAAKFEKFGTTLMATCYWELEGDEIRTMSFGKRYLQFYDGEDLVVYCQDRRSEVEQHRISAPDTIGTARLKPFPTPPKTVEMLCLLMINRSTQKQRFQPFYNQSGHPECGFNSEVGMDYAIRISTNLLDCIIRQYALSDAT